MTSQEHYSLVNNWVKVEFLSVHSRITIESTFVFYSHFVYLLYICVCFSVHLSTFAFFRQLVDCGMIPIKY